MFPGLSFTTRPLRAGMLAFALAIAAPASAIERIDRDARGSPSAGAALVLNKGCGACHVIPGIEGANGVVGPPLTMIGRRIFIAGLLRNTPENLAAWVYDPQRFVPGNAMPSSGLSTAEAVDVAAYLETIR
jgi:cytochrome c2